MSPNARGNPGVFHNKRGVSTWCMVSATFIDMSPSVNAVSNTANTTEIVANVPTMLKYESNRGVRNNAVGMVSTTAMMTIWVFFDTAGNSFTK